MQNFETRQLLALREGYEREMNALLVQQPVTKDRRREYHVCADLVRDIDVILTERSRMTVSAHDTTGYVR